MKKMTCKEFKEVLNEVGVGFNSWEQVLVQIANYQFYEAKDFDKKGLKYGAKGYRDCGLKIVEILDERGFYDNLSK